MSKAMDLTGQKFGRLTVISSDERHNGGVDHHCLCDCGTQCFVNTSHLRSGGTKSWGCLARELSSKRMTKQSTRHGMHNTRIYKIFYAMIFRCENPNNLAYKNYGGRGIKVCERWHSFENFYADVGDPPEGMTLDRWPDNDGDYEPTNFRWATYHEQHLNKRPRSSGYNRQRWFYGHGLNGEMIIENNQSHVARIFGLCFQNISKCLYGKRPHCQGWTFQWLPN